METKNNAIGICDWVQVFELPMRDGNQYFLNCLSQYSNVFELPMRDGN